MAGKEEQPDKAEGGGEESAPQPEDAVLRVVRSQRRLTWTLLALMFVVMGVSGAELYVLRDRLGAIESRLDNRVGRTADDFARIQDQTAAMRGGLGLMHQEIARIGTRLDEVERRLRPQTD